MKIRAWLASGFAGLMAALSGATAFAAPSYDFIEFNYVQVNHDSPSYADQGGNFLLSARIAPYLIFDASYQMLDSERLTVGLDSGRLRSQFVTAGLAGRFPIVRNLLDLTGGVDYVFVDVRGTRGLEDKVPSTHDSGVQAKLAMRTNLRYFEVVPGVRHIRVSDEHEWAFGVQVLGCPGYGICLTGGYEYFEDAKDNRFTGGIRLYYD